MTIQEAAKEFATPARIEALESTLKLKKNRRVRLSGLRGSAPGMLFAGLSLREGNKKNIGPRLIVADDPDAAGYLYHDLCQVLGPDRVMAFPSGYRRDIKFGQADPAQQILRAETLEALGSASDLKWVVASPEGLAEKVPVPSRLEAETIIIDMKTRTTPTEVATRLRELGFKETDYVYEPGQFARRGSILDVFSFSSEYPYRIDFFDNEIDSLRTFSVETQLSQGKEERIAIIPTPTGGMTAEEGVSLLEYFDEGGLVFAHDFAWLQRRIREIASENFSNSALLANEGDTAAMSNVVDPDSFIARLEKMRHVEFGTPADSEAGETPDAVIRFDTSLQTIYHKNFELISESFSRLLKEGYTLLILSDSVHQTDRLRDIFNDRGDEISFTPVDRTIHEGFLDNELKICWFTDHQIFDRFHKYSLRSDRARSGKVALSLKELNQIEPGDFIVHTDHGIGRFAGLIKTDVNGRPQELIKLVYQNDDIILVSIHALHKLSKYRAKEGVPPKIGKLGSGAWQKLKDRTKTKMKDIARDLIKLYAARREEKGFQYSPDSYLQNELEASFIYEDTPDQLKATQAIKSDMESPRPMDRLVCGDVGFGKTELAIRAAFKAAVDGKQTAVLVPTTVLAMQHYRTFSSRLKELPVRVEFLSRARSAKDTKQILADLAEGKIDIIIGTHKLVGKNVKFKDLGLLVIDEEQKFGVSVKEKLKQLKVNVDTLTLSATPIPRTLQFSLMGARDLSSLNTPPANRQPIETTVCGLDDSVLTEAVNFELSRNGQIFFISNRIENLNELEDKLHRLVPGIKTVRAHGQMPPEQLEKAILDFAAGDYDVLLSTTIVENGIDMPNVNTILVNNAQNFGLSELHQLRGRVGRSSRKAFCYLFVPPGLPLSPVARRRLQAIENFSDLGSGIHIAMQDLDIRGAGNLLGAEQSGFIADLGYETYQKLLKESVLELKTEEFGDTFTDVNAGKEEEFTTDCAVESDLELRLPPDYVPQEAERIALYQQLDNMETPQEVECFRNSLRDRFGKIPEVTEELIRVVPLRMAAKRLGIERLVLKGGNMYLYFVGDDNKAYYNSPAFGRMLAWLQLNPKQTQLREIRGKRSFLISDVEGVSKGLEILNTILTLNPL